MRCSSPTTPGDRVYTLRSADAPYRALVEQMQEGAVTLNAKGDIVYCNQRFAELVGDAAAAGDRRADRSSSSSRSGDLTTLIGDGDGQAAHAAPDARAVPPSTSRSRSAT